MTIRDTKLAMIDALLNRGEWIKQVNDYQYRTRCPFCGDSQKNLNTGHLYIRIDPDDNFPMVYNCFKCPASGVIDKEFLSVMDISDINLQSNIRTLNKYSDNISAHKFIYGDKTIMFDYKRPDIQLGFKTQYIEDRLGVSLSNDDFNKMKVITSLREFLIMNEIKKLTCDDRTAMTLESNYVGFLSFGNSHILFRDVVNQKSKYPWVKYPITNESNQCRAFYSMESEIDIFSEETLEINLAEGVMDTLSACYNLGHDGSNSMNIAVCGKHYNNIIYKLIGLGLIGKNINVNIFSDNDQVYNKKSVSPTDINYFKRILQHSKNLFGNINVYYNKIGKDIGVHKDEIVLTKYKI